MYAQKDYVTIYGALDESNGVSLSGAVPSSMKLKYTADDFPELHLSYSGVYCWIGAVLNLLAKEGFTVEQMNTTASSYGNLNGSVSSRLYINYLLSKSSDDSSTSNARMVRDMNNDSEVYEVARYNLQGMPVNESEKGFQIIVYSNFTTKTIIKE